MTKNFSHTYLGMIYREWPLTHRTKTGAPVPNDDGVADQCSLCDSLTFASYLNNHGGGIGACVQVAAG